VTHRPILTILLTLSLAAASVEDLRNATRKIDEIKSDRLRAGTGVTLTLPELNAWAVSQLPTGVRDAHVRVDSPGIATATAMVDLAKVSRAKGFEPGWLLSKILEGDRPVLVTARIESSNGAAIVYVRRVEIAGLEMDGKTLEMLIDHVLLPIYPNAAVGRPFDLGHNIDRFDIQPAAVRVVIGKPR